MTVMINYGVTVLPLRITLPKRSRCCKTTGLPAVWSEASADDSKAPVDWPQPNYGRQNKPPLQQAAAQLKLPGRLETPPPAHTQTGLITLLISSDSTGTLVRTARKAALEEEGAA
jgi:hypothetical protein